FDADGDRCRRPRCLRQGFHRIMSRSVSPNGSSSLQPRVDHLGEEHSNAIDPRGDSNGSINRARPIRHGPSDCMATTLDLATFVPPVVRELLASGDGTPAQDRTERFEAALLFADAEGFSGMSTALIAQDTRAA